MHTRLYTHTLFALFIIATFMFPITQTYAQEDFPLRPYYPEVTPISTEKLMAEYDSTVIIDIRSRLEYEVAHINKAVLLPLTLDDFAEKLGEVRPKNSPETLAFYCNGHSCAKSYQAAQLSLSLGFENVFVYDGGIFDWITATPERATLMGETPARANRIIDAEKFLRHQIAYDEFVAAAKEPNTVVIDIRDPFQRNCSPRIEDIRNIPLDPLLDLVTSRIWTEKKLLIFDAVGKQIRWLQYFLNAYDYFDYAFLEGGMQSIANAPEKMKPVIEADQTVITSQPMLLKLTADQRLNNADRKVISYLLANIKFNNYVVIDIHDISRDTGINSSLLINSMKKLTAFGYATHSIMQGMLIAQVDPRLAWKGDSDTPLWNQKVKEFDAAIQQ